MIPLFAAGKEIAERSRNPVDRELALIYATNEQLLRKPDTKFTKAFDWYLDMPPKQKIAIAWRERSHWIPCAVRKLLEGLSDLYDSGAGWHIREALLGHDLADVTT